MGFLAPKPPKPDPQLVAQQKAEAALARVDRISLIQQQLDGEDQLRARVYGQRGGTSLFTKQAPFGMRNLFMGLYSGARIPGAGQPGVSTPFGTITYGGTT